MTELPRPLSQLEIVPAPVRRVRRRAPGRDRDHQLPGRPRQIKLRLSHDEYASIAAAARDAGLTPSGYAAETALAAAVGTDPPTATPWRAALAELIEARTQVRRVGTNINQATRTINTDGDPPIWLEHALRMTERAIERLDLSAGVLQSLALHPPSRNRPGSPSPTPGRGTR